MRRHGQEIRLRNGGNVSSEDVLACVEDVFAALADEGAIVPGNFHAEVAQALLRAEREQKFTEKDFARVAEDLQSMRLNIVAVPFASMIRLARQYKISTCDAMYLTVAIEHNAPLVTLDAKLKSAAKAEKIAWAPRSE